MPEDCVAVPPFAAGCGIVPADIDAMRGEMWADRREIRSLQRDETGTITGEEVMRGTRAFAFTPGGRLALWAAPRGVRRQRLLVARGPYDALCAAAWEGHRQDTVYAAPPGRLVARARDALVALILQAGTNRVVVAVGGSDGLADEIAGVVADLPSGAIAVERVIPPQGNWAAAMRALHRAAAA